MIDSHCHLLPGVDDGAPDDAVALEMARVALDDGIGTIVATPHMREGDFPNEGPEVRAGVERLRAVFADAGCPLEVAIGGEIHLVPDILGKVKDGRLLTYGDKGRSILLECPYRTKPVGLENTIFELRVAGITPVIAHPERTRWFIEDPLRFEEIVRLGALGSLTSSSLNGTFGKTIRVLSESWVRRRLVHILASDAHDPSYRPPTMSEARARWAEIDDEEHARLACETWPRALIDGEAIQPDPPLEDDPPRGFLSRLFSRD